LQPFIVSAVEGTTTCKRKGKLNGLELSEITRVRSISAAREKSLEKRRGVLVGGEDEMSNLTMEESGESGDEIVGFETVGATIGFDFSRETRTEV